MNPKAETVEDLKGRRKLLHMSMTTLAEGDFRRQVIKIDELLQVRRGSRVRAASKLARQAAPHAGTEAYRGLAREDSRSRAVGLPGLSRTIEMRSG